MRCLGKRVYQPSFVLFSEGVLLWSPGWPKLLILLPLKYWDIRWAPPLHQVDFFDDVSSSRDFIGPSWEPSAVPFPRGFKTKTTSIAQQTIEDKNIGTRRQGTGPPLKGPAQPQIPTLIFLWVFSYHCLPGSNLAHAKDTSEGFYLPSPAPSCGLKHRIVCWRERSSWKCWARW